MFLETLELDDSNPPMENKPRDWDTLSSFAASDRIQSPRYLGCCQFRQIAGLDFPLHSGSEWHVALGTGIPSW